MKNSISTNPALRAQKPKRILVPGYVQVSGPKDLLRANVLVKLWQMSALPKVGEGEKPSSITQTT